MGAVNKNSEYEAIARDRKKINDLRSKYNLDKKDDVAAIYKLLSSGDISFETKLGSDFDDKIYSLYKESEKAASKGKGKIDKKANDAKPSAKRISLDDFDESMQSQIIKELHKREKKRHFLTFLSILIGVFCLGCFIFYYLDAGRSEKRWNDISGLIGSRALTQSDEKTTVIATLSDGAPVELKVLDKYETLYNSNKKLIGWIKIADTNIDYPVMQCADNTYYLNHNFDQQEDSVGALFLDYQCDVVNGCDNYIIYGHHLKSGKMFSSLPNYESETYYKNHKLIYFDTIYEQGTYQVMFAFRSRVYNQEDVVFKYYQFINANSEEEFNSYMNEMAELSYYDTGVRASYGDQLLTLSTCDYNETNGRFVVVARRIN